MSYEVSTTAQGSLNVDGILLEKDFGLTRSHPEYQQIIVSVTELMEKIQAQFPSHFTFTPSLSGSVAEDTKSGRMDEMDFLCALKINGIDSFEVREIDDRATGIQKTFLCFECPEEARTFRGVKRTPEFETDYYCLDNAKVCSEFSKHLIAAINMIQKKDLLPKNIYIYRKGQTESKIPSLAIKWRSVEQPDLDISVDVVPCVKFDTVSYNYSVLLESLNMSFPGELLAVAKDAGFDDMSSSHWRLAFSNIEISMMLSVFPWCRLAYVLLKSLRNERVYPPVRKDNFTIIKTDKDLPSYVFKTCLLFSMQEQGLLDRSNQSSTEDQQISDYKLYISGHFSHICSMSLKVIHKIRHFLTELGGIPHFFNPTYDIVFGYSIVQGHNINRLSDDGPQRKRADRIFMFCDFAENFLKQSTEMTKL